MASSTSAVAGTFAGGNVAGAVLRPQTQLPQGCGGAAVAGGAEMQIGFRVLGAVAAVYVKVKQRCIRIGGGKQPANVALGNFDRFGYHFGASQKTSFSVIIPQLPNGDNGGAAENFAEKRRFFLAGHRMLWAGERTSTKTGADAHAACASVLRFSFIRKNSVAECTQVRRSLLPAQESLNTNLFRPLASD